jgi:hypothetical protein
LKQAESLEVEQIEQGLRVARITDPLWPSDFQEGTGESAYEFIKQLKTWDEAGQQIREFPDKQYLKEIAKIWVECRKTGQPLLIEKSRRLVTSWVLRALELYDIGLTRGKGLITHTKRDDAAEHVWRIWFMYDDLRTRFPSWELPTIKTWGNELSYTLDKLALANGSSVQQYFEKPKGLQGTGFSWVTMEELSIYQNPSGMWDQVAKLVQPAPGDVHGLRVGVTNHYMSDGYYRVKEGASPSPY